MRSPEDFPEDIREKAWKLVCDQPCAMAVCTFQNGCGCFDVVAAALLAERLSATEKLRDPPIEALQAMWEAMFTEPWDGTQAVMMGAGFDAAVAAIRSQP